MENEYLKQLENKFGEYRKKSVEEIKELIANLEDDRQQCEDVFNNGIEVKGNNDDCVFSDIDEYNTVLNNK